VPIDPFLLSIMLVAALPTFAISRNAAGGWRSGVVFAAFYPALLLLVGILMVTAFLLLAWTGLINLD
jgi:hypothetical protein